ncbi:hypothetical protein Vi05172_g9729 [Venturia inaequalis]|nr:hypothetical protein Vi05172_g9729 [Venturia inaequalis]
MLNICRNCSILICSPADSTCIAQIQRRFISRNTAIHRGLRQEASGGRTERPWEDRNKAWENRVKPSWERHGSQADPEPFLKRSGNYPKRWEDRSNQRPNNEGGSPNSYEKTTFETRSYGGGERKWEEKRSRPQRREPKPREHRGSKPWTQHHETKAWEASGQALWGEQRYQREIDDQDSSRSNRSNNRGAPSSTNDAEAAPLGFTRSAFGRDQGDGRHPQSRPVLHKEYKESKYKAESEPISIPYTTAASEFLYGYNPVRAALKARRRKLYKVYIHPRVAGREDADHIQSLIALAESAKVEVKDVGDSWLRVMDKMSDYRPHNGVVLEVSPLPRLPVVSLGPVQKKEDGEEGFHLTLGPQSTEDLAVSGNSSWQFFKSHKWRSPFVLLIDDVTNPGNLGAIIRSAHFLGVDAIALSTRTCAPLNADVVKVSAGAVEAIPIFKVENVSKFLEQSAADYGTSWNIYAATTPGKFDVFEERRRHSYQQGALLFTSRSFSIHAKHAMGNTYGLAFRSPLGVGRPVILAIGGEQKGLDRAITQRAMAFVQILPPRERVLDVDVDSLNVSAASAILCAQFMTRRPEY